MTWVKLDATHPPGAAETATGGTTMKHFTTEEWIDFVNESAPHTKQQAMQEHLANGCQGCEEKFALWQKVRSTAASEANYQPPADAVRMVKAEYARARMGSHDREAKSLVEVLFDSFLQPEVAGARSRATGARQMLFRADSFQIGRASCRERV